ncbi:carboxypeptidase regulatory-like domain-containing protein [Longimicrobium sp.]|uniref:carboxypeptidase regulatory-like domain-containing protein n=1 Tax=Longimicrobium sp. TaxID=2029185 RepID=UPI003B3A795D
MRRISLLICLLSVCAVPPLASQVRIDGIVIDDATGQPIPDAQVRVHDGWAGWRRRHADSVGNFSVTVGRLGVFRLQVRSPGYPDVAGQVVTGAFPYQNIEVRMRKGEQVRIPVTVLTRTQQIPSPRQLGFHHRLRNGGGAYVTREQVSAVRPGYISDMIALTPGVLVRRTGRLGENRFLFARREAEGSGVQGVECPLRVLLDAQLVNSRSASGELEPAMVDYTVDQTLVDGIEIYLDPAAVPAEFHSPEARCGAVLIWTRRQVHPTSTTADAGADP